MRTRAVQCCLAAAILAAILCVAFGDIVFLGRTLLASNLQSGTMPDGAYGYSGRRVGYWPVIDSVAPASQYEPYVKIVHDYMARRWLPLWDPYVGSGAPLLANMAPAVLSPMRLVLASVNNPAFWDFYLLFRLFLAAFFTYLFAREVGIGFTGSLAAGVIFCLSGHFVYYINMPDLDAQIWLPALLLVTHKLAQKPTYRNFAIAAVLIALIILAGMPESAFYIFLLSTLYLLFCLWNLKPIEEKNRTWRRPLIAFAAAGITGFLISLPQVLPFIEYLQNAFNPRASGVGMGHFSAGTAASLPMRSFFGHLHASWNGVDAEHMLPYIGSVCCLLALAGICRKGPQRRLNLFLVGFVAFYLLKVFGIPPVQWVGHLPLFSMTLFPKHAFPEFSICMAVLAGMGADSLLNNSLNYSRFLFASAVLALVVLGFAAFYWNEAVYFGGLRDLTENCLIFDVAFGLVWLLAIAARRFAGSKIIATALVLIPALELMSFIPRNRADRYNAFTKPPFVDFLRSDPQPYRTFSVDGILSPNTSAAYGISDIRSLDPLQVSRYINLLRAEFSPSIYDRFDASEVSRQIFRSSLLDLMNVKYVLANPELPVSAISSKFKLIYDHEIRIYRNRNVLPRAFIVGHAEVVSDKNRALAKLEDPDFDPKENVILEQSPANYANTALPAVSSVTFERYEPNYIRLKAELNRTGWLVLADTYYPGWKVFIDGRPGRIWPADFMFRGVPLHAGSHVVEFTYRPASFVWGVAISFVTIVILVCVPLWNNWVVRKTKSREGRLLSQVSDYRESESLVCHN